MYSNEPHSNAGSLLRQVVLGGQDGLVNVLGVLLGVAVATNDARVVLVAGIAATFAESISMAAVAYTSSKAAKSHYDSELAREKKEIREIPEAEVDEIRDIYRKRGFKGKLLEQVVKQITSNEKVWLEVMMSEELSLTESAKVNPAMETAVVGFSSLLGSLIPLLPFFFLPAGHAIPLAVALSVVALFAAGAYGAKLTIGSWWKKGVELAAVGMLAALAGFAIGSLLGTTV